MQTEATTVHMTPPTDASGLSGECAQKEALALKEAATKAYRSSQFEEAERLYREAYSLTPENLLLLNNIGAVYLEQKRYEDCLAVTEEALARRYEVKADYAVIAKIFCRRGACFMKMKRFDDAIDAYKKSLVEVNERPVRQLLREAEAAKEKAALLAQIDPADADRLRAEGNELFKAKNSVEAKAKYDEALRRNPYDARIYSNRAACYIQLLEYPSALIDCEKALNLVAHSEEATGPAPEDDLEEQLKRTKVDKSVVCRIYCRQGICHFKLKDYNKAVNSYQQALKVDPANAEAKRGYEQVMYTIRASASSTEVDQEQQARAMADPEIQQILGDPQMRMILQNIQNDPSRLMEAVKDEKIASALSKLMAAGILRTA